ncbi:LCP family protein [Ohessyouella blattaphilus]|uniref:LCP family protein n=1 Tax=Ohessyouella blattaphilus TaxID=2949333 RepID=UPI003EBE0323
MTDRYITIALFGADSREGELVAGTRTDAIIVLSIKKDTGAVKLLSVDRDTLIELQVGTQKEYKQAGVAYYLGGPEGGISMLNQTLDLAITDYVTVNFEGLSTIIDALGGVTLTVDEAEKDFINTHIFDTGTWAAVADEKPEFLYETGVVQATGKQAMAYSRNRFTPFTKTDGTQVLAGIARTERQRVVLKQMLSKIKEAKLSDVLRVAERVKKSETPIISTSLSRIEILDILKLYKKLQVGESTLFPAEREEADIVQCGFSVIPVDLKSSVVQAHNYLYDEESYQVSSEVVKLQEKLSEIFKQHSYRRPDVLQR